MYRHADAALVRAATHLAGTDLPPWPDLTGSTDADAGQWRDWLEHVWSQRQLAEAIEVASPVLARQVGKALAGHCDEPRQMRRIVMSVARYVLRMTDRATPFGLFAGVAPAAFGPRLLARWGEDHHPVARPGAEWLASVVTVLESCPELLRRLPVVASNLCVVRGDRLVTPSQQHIGGPGDSTGQAPPVEVSVRHTRAVETALRYARSPIVAGDLAARLAADFPQASQAVISGMLAELVRLRMLVTSLRAPMTVTDALSHVAGQLTAVRADGIPQVAALVRELRAICADIACHDQAGPRGGRREQRARLAARMRCTGGAAEPLLAVDLRLDAEIVLPQEIAREAAAAAAALTRLTPHPAGLPAWQHYHAAFIERYGPGAVVPLAEVINPDTGLGFPATYRGSAAKLPAPS